MQGHSVVTQDVLFYFQLQLQIQWQYFSSYLFEVALEVEVALEFVVEVENTYLCGLFFKHFL